VLAAGALLVACRSEPPRTTAAFCEALGQALTGLEGPTATQADLDALVARYDELAARAPLGVEADWTALTELVHTAVTVVPSDAASVQALIEAAYRTERPARRVEEWAATHCALTMPAVIGLEATTTTTTPPADAPVAPDAP
jgi:hypothetical protein